MLKRFLVVVFFAITASSFGFVYIDEGFESGTLGNVTVTDVDGDGNNWQIFPTKAGDYQAVSVSSGSTPDNTMLFPSTWMERDTYLNFYVGSTNAESSEHYEIYIADDDIDPANFILVHEETLTSGGMKNVEISLKPFFFQFNEWFWDANISVKIRHYNTSANSAGSSLVIDDFRVIYYPTFSYDEYYFLKPADVVEPFSTVSMRWAPYDQSAYDIDWNYIGFDNIFLHYIITDVAGLPQSEDSLSLTLNPDPDFSETYLVDVPGYAMGTTMEYWVEATDKSGYQLVGKSLHFNVEWGEINFNEGFEYAGPEVTPPEGWMPDGWVAFQTGTPDDAHDVPWAVDIAYQNVHTGLYSCTSESQNNWGPTLTVDYLVSPRFRVNGKPTLKYFMNADTNAGEEFTERWSVLISTVDGSGTDLENFVEIKTDSIVPTADNKDKWCEKLISLGDYENEYVRIMWKHQDTFSLVKLDRHLNLDDVSVAEFPVIVSIEGPGNAAAPGEDAMMILTATDYSGINNVTIYYTVAGYPEESVVMTDNGDGTFTGSIPGQPLHTKCTWYAVVTDNSMFSNTTTTEVNQIVWYESGIIEWGSNYTDWPEYMTGGNKVAIDWDLGTKNNLYINQIEVGLAYDAPDLIWKLVEFDGTPTDNVIGDLQGTHTFSSGGDVYFLEGNSTPIYGHVALEFEFNQENEIMVDESGDKSHTWQWNPVQDWITYIWGTFYIKMYVSQIPNGIEDEFISSTTELCQNYPNPFNPATSISFYNRTAGDVSLFVYNTKGERVASLLNERMNEGFRKVNFDASALNSGVYYYTLKTPEKTLTRKMVLVK